jgi:hypothetical protein
MLNHSLNDNECRVLYIHLRIKWCRQMFVVIVCAPNDVINNRFYS